VAKYWTNLYQNDDGSIRPDLLLRYISRIIFILTQLE
jgi:hypothetical protein